ncbi:ParA family protein [Sphingobacterium sp. UDSM-2020]|uniref:ParA family protein n=1 Tax=Sphingobacterium sp. UDSM-2020 TaxID=2795738 RepID=UPI001936EE63|nr:ParA family protein [Sphingobacterium sp. UDSM-2020]QQD14383.1 ParA family protein [Sphingobacterium sp. UDSM-2020]
MLILIGNQKGGAGKSTLTLLLANYLTQQQERRVTVLDMDYQQSLSAKAEKAKILENEPLYEIVPADLGHFPAMQRKLEKSRNEIVLVDLPGKMDDDGLIPIFAAADAVLCPFAFDEFSVDSTLLFAMVIGKINKRAPLIFVPNRIKNTVKYETRTEVEKVLRGFGTVAPGLPDRIDFQRINTFQIPIILYPVVLPLLELIYEQYIAKEEPS